MIKVDFQKKSFFEIRETSIPFYVRMTSLSPNLGILLVRKNMTYASFGTSPRYSKFGQIFYD